MYEKNTRDTDIYFSNTVDLFPLFLLFMLMYVFHVFIYISVYLYI